MGKLIYIDDDLTPEEKKIAKKLRDQGRKLRAEGKKVKVGANKIIIDEIPHHFTDNAVLSPIIRSSSSDPVLCSRRPSQQLYHHVEQSASPLDLPKK